MPRSIVTRTIDAPVDVVFQTVSDINHFSEAIPHIVNVEILSDVQSGVGTRFRETRLMRGKEATTELEVTEFVENERVRIISDTHGTVWDTLFSVEDASGQTELTMDMEARAYKLLPRLMNPFVMSTIKGALESDMDAVKDHCEAQQSVS